MAIERVAAHCKIIVDDSFLSDDAGSSVLIDRLLPALEARADAKLIVPERVFKTVQDRQNAAGLRVIRGFARRQKLERRQEENEVAGLHAETKDLLVRVAYQFQQQHELAFLTLDAPTAHALLATNKTGAIEHAKPLRVLRLNHAQNDLEDWNATDFCPVPDENAETDYIPHTLNVRVLAAETRIFVDTCSFMTPAATLFFRKQLIPALMSR